MVERNATALDDVFAALGDPTRRAILRRLRRAPATVTEIAEPFDMSLNAVSKHLKVLERAHLIRRERIGREHRCSIDAAPMRVAASWIEEYRSFWENKLDAMAVYLHQRRVRAARLTSESHE